MAAGYSTGFGGQFRASQAAGVSSAIRLIGKLAKPGKIVKEVKREAVGVIEWTLSNGARVVIKPTDYQADEVSLLVSRLEPLIRGEVRGVELTASVGIAWHPADDPHFSIDDAIRNADEAMYEAKRAGGAQCAIYSPAIEQS